MQSIATRRAALRVPAAGQRSVRFPVCRSVETETAAAAQAAEDAKMKSTMAALDALLPTPPPAPKPVSAPAAPKPAAAPAALPKLPSLPASPAPSSAPARKPAGLTFDQVMGFSGLAPELINGRAAMIGIVVALANEARTGESIFAQSVSGGAAQALAVIALVTLASFAPAVRAPLDAVFNKVAPKQVKEFGPFTVGAEMLNGRLAMAGLALMLFFEGAGPYAFFMN
ncbi:hypothetical protein HYH02_014762 [Chlamydomonas schloesseri]|uniref:Uncharacterized protein n=1 Tax=Chlamydomonas schloesseri TaxID=2026947 RepID=A0A835SKL7_9CHLO|nr:hypothetical protein HYH02_014762 [Chlamydomonas schloesseri]|eukprot:KAG2426722.1 hypothetical protein HYH02_014762 [Chlamydomonas schloesseri]